MGGDLWRSFGVKLDLDQAGMRAWALPQFRSALVARQNVGIAVFAKAGLIGIVPGTSAHLNHTWAQDLVDNNAAQTGTPLVEQSHKIAVFKSTQSGIIGMNVKRFPPGNFLGFADGPVVKLRMQFIFGLVRNQVKRIAVYIPQPLIGLLPDWMTRAIVIAKISDSTTIDFNFTAWGG